MWYNLQNIKPPSGIRVKVSHMITGIGAPERSGWESTGIMLKSGTFSVKEIFGLDLNRLVEQPPTHWDYIK